VSELVLTEVAAGKLSALVGGPIRVLMARWLKPKQEGQTPRLLVKLDSMAMVRAVLQLKGRPNGPPSKLSAGQKVMPEFGPTQLAVRDVLFKEAEAQRQAGRTAWVACTTLIVGGQAQPMPAEAMEAGRRAMAQRSRPSRWDRAN
jgi:hypothetical protein